MEDMPETEHAGTPGPASTGSDGIGSRHRTAAARFVRPTRWERDGLNRVVSGLVRLGLDLRGARLLHVQGRSSGRWYTTPVNPMPFEGATYLVAPRGHTGWVRNLRALGVGRLQRGRRTVDFEAVEVADDDKGPLVREYLHRWAFETAKFFDGLDADSTDAEIAAVAPDFPVFRIEVGGTG